MIRVREALHLTSFQEFELQAGEGGLENEITNVTMLDYETDARDYSAFQRGDFILSSLYFAKNDESLILDAFRALAVKGISGFAIKRSIISPSPSSSAVWPKPPASPFSPSTPPPWRTSSSPSAI